MGYECIRGGVIVYNVEDYRQSNGVRTPSLDMQEQMRSIKGFVELGDNGGRAAYRCCV
jgi:hypothetical protein